MKRFIASSLLLCVASFTSAAGAEVRPTPAAPIDLAIKSSFTMESSGRNPFWPIGWKPLAKAANAGESVGPSISPSAFVVSSIMVDPSGRFAIINGKAMEEGQQFGLQIGTQTQQLTVKRIEDGRVILANRDEEIPIPLRRK